MTLSPSILLGSALSPEDPKPFTTVSSKQTILIFVTIDINF